MKIGFIDYYLDEWHANNYPELIKNISEGKHQVAFAYGKIDHPAGGMTNKQWSEKYGVQLFDTIEEVVERSDCLVVLSPDNPEMHEELCEIPLKSGKYTYVDKTFAPDRETAERIFGYAQKHGTKIYSSSALRFAAELSTIDKKAIKVLYTKGPGTFDIYSIHQIEPIVALMETPAKRVMFTGKENHPAMVIEFADGRTAHMFQTGASGFEVTVDDEANVGAVYKIEGDFFAEFIKAMLSFFETGKTPVSPEQTVDVMGIIEAGKKAMKNPFEWVEV